MPPSTVATPIRQPTRGSGNDAAATPPTNSAPASQVSAAAPPASTGTRSARRASGTVGARPATSHRSVPRWRRTPSRVPTGSVTSR